MRLFSNLLSSKPSQFLLETKRFANKQDSLRLLGLQFSEDFREKKLKMSSLGESFFDSKAYPLGYLMAL